ncbi:ATP-binding cassette domain-containing protein [Georgenia sp. EYE_87]|uniref:branched-chain amino acid ABC transporter ATP-binding protein/permease n=1 Tax=Georgenia sp. EYE_87 TaxID=2853448 RepID=UPI002004D538|nr:ATP-binding cassette domain-containing protein [Georgenia sp. EYE_87]MCK6211377.1 ATP-binding cassette domain-containing protein [Georgenia sp. EYE_87]
MNLSPRIARIQRRHLLGLAVAVVALAAAPFILTSYPLSLLTLSLAYGLFAFGLDLAWGRAGVISIGHAAFFGVGAYGVAIATEREIPLLLAIPVTVALTAVIAFAVGLAGLRRGTSPSTMAVLTLALTLLAEQAARSLLSLTNGSNGLFVGSGGIVSTYYRTAIVVALTVGVVWAVLLRGRFGRRLLAVRINEPRSEHLGIDPRRVKIQAFVLSAVVAALAGVVVAPIIGLVSPGIAGVVMSTQVLVFLAVGGRGSILGAFLGAALVTIGQEYLGAAIGSWYLFVIGIIFVLVVRFAPGGLVGLVTARLRRPVSEAAAQGAVVQPPAARPDVHDSRRAATDGAADRMPEAAIEVRDLAKSFDATPVIRGVNLEINRGEVVCLIGPNGAGKTTLLNLIAGDLRPTSGQIRLKGQEVASWPPHHRAALGLGRLFQTPSVYPELTPAQNLALAQAEAYQFVTLPSELARFADIDDTLTSDLSLADQRALELALTIAWGPEIVLLDEPAAGLSHEDSVRLAATLRAINQDLGCTLVVVEHDMDIVRQLGDRVVVLAEGRVLVSGDMDEVASHDEVRAAYIGAV